MIPGCQADANVRPMWVLCGSNVFFHGVPWRIRDWAEAEQVGDLLQRGVPWVWWTDWNWNRKRSKHGNSMGAHHEIHEKLKFQHQEKWEFTQDFSNIFLGTQMQWGYNEEDYQRFLNQQYMMWLWELAMYLQFVAIFWWKNDDRQLQIRGLLYSQTNAFDIVYYGIIYYIILQF